MHGTQTLSTASTKIAKPIDALLVWAYGDELPKRKTSSAEGIWDGIAEYGQRGGIDVGHGAAQRYPHFGLPHKDALAIEKAVSALPDVVIDWAKHFDMIAWDMAPLVSVNDVRAASKPGAVPVHQATIAPAADGRGVTALAERPRDVLLVNSINVEALVYTHAMQGTRPSAWRVNQMRAVPTLAERGIHTKIVGICKGKNSYTSGSYCPLRWEPSPLKIVIARGNYFAWHQALTMLADSLKLTDFIALPPEAGATPWIYEEPLHRILRQPAVRSRPLPLKPARKLAGPPKRRPQSRGRVISL